MERLYQLIPTGQSLRAQATRRLLLVAMIAVFFLISISSISYRLLLNQELEQRSRELDAHFALTLPRLVDAHAAEARQLAARLAYSGLLRMGAAQRRVALQGFLESQWVGGHFSHLFLLDRDGVPIFRFGLQAEALESQLAGRANWLLQPGSGQLSRLYRMVVDLGAQGSGELVLVQGLTDSLLRELAMPQTQLQLLFQGREVAASKAGLGQDQDSLRREIAWKGEPEAETPVLVVYWDRGDSLPYAKFVARPLMASLLFIILLWFGLGRWLTRTTRRIESLGFCARQYAEHHDRGSLGPALKPALSHDDEVRDTARAFESLVEAIEEQNQEQRSYLETLSLLDEAVIEFDGEGKILRASPGWTKLSGQFEPVGNCMFDFIHGEDVPVLQQQVANLMSGEKHAVRLRLRLFLQDASSMEEQELWIEARLLAFEDIHGQVISIRGVIRDITQVHIHEQQITHMALHDALTELPNRVLLEDRFKIALRLAARNRELVAVCFIDLDHFKLVNDSLGHKAGDRLLQCFSEMLRQQLRQGDTLARWGGDEFVLLLPEMKSEADIRQVTAKLVVTMQQALDVDGNDLRVTFSMGAAIYPADGEDMETLFSHADRAMFHAKAQGRNQVCFFQDMASKGLGKKELFVQNRLAAAIEQNQVQAWFQPVVDAGTRCCTSLEVLARWHDEELGWISPGIFIPMAETLGLISPLGSQIMLASLDALARFRLLGFDILVAVNISKRQLFVHEFAEWLLAEVARRDLRPEDLILEITESVALNDVERGADIIQRLAQAGFLIAIDDFGTGYSSLSQLHELNAGELKIDISFVRRIQSPEGRSMVQAIINMAQALEMKTVAEGVETEACAEQLRGMGVDCLQGYLFGKPMRLDAFEAWLVENHGPGRERCHP